MTNAWIDLQHLLDSLYAPVGRALTAEVTGPAVLDVGCGTGATTVEIARKVKGRVVGVDISAPMIEAARGRGEDRAEFVVADAQEHPFEERFDTVMSRFGVMFFADPVRAFANLRRATRPAGSLRCVVWRSAEENPFMTTAERAAAPLLPDLPTRPADGPGQFAFADPDRVRGILSDAGWSRVSIDPVDIACSLPAADLDAYIGRLGPVGMTLQKHDAAAVAEVVGAVRPAFAPFIHGDAVRFVAACHLVGALAP